MLQLLFKSAIGVMIVAIPVEVLAVWITAGSWRVLAPTDTRRWLPALVAVCALHAAPLFFLLARWSSGRLTDGMPPEAGAFERLLFFHTAGGGLLAAAQFAALALPLILLLFLIGGAFPAWKASVRRRGAFVLVALFAATAVYVPQRMLHDATSIDVDRATVLLPGRPRGALELRIAVISDMQLDEYTTAGRIREYFDKVNAERPDIILVAGDVVTMTTGMLRVPEAVALMHALRAPNGIYAVLGDHDLWAGRGREKVPALLRAAGITVLDDSVAHIHTDAGEIAVAGLTDLKDAPASIETRDRLLIALRASAGRPGAAGPAISILLTHQSTAALIRACAESGVTMVASGHTHGGQVAVSVYGWKLSSTRLETPHVSGFWKDGTLAYVCSGLGFSVLPFRYLATPSFGIVTFRPGNETAGM